MFKIRHGERRKENGPRYPLASTDAICVYICKHIHEEEDVEEKRSSRGGEGRRKKRRWRRKRERL